MAKRPKTPRTKVPRPPKYCLHGATGQAYIKTSGRRVYLGKYDSPASRAAYAAAVNAIVAGEPVESRPVVQNTAPVREVTVREVCERFIRYAETYYVKNGKQTSEVGTVTKACETAAEYFGDVPVTSFGPLSLKAVRSVFVERGLARTTVNGQVGRICRAFRWAASEELIPASVPQALATVTGLRAGKTPARETAPVCAVDDAVVDATLPHLPEVVADMVRLQRATGMRPGEVCELRPGDVDRTGCIDGKRDGIANDRGEVWTYRPASHKTEHHGRERVVFIGPRGQSVLLKYLARPADAYCFSPAESERKRREQAHAERTTPLSCGNRPGKGNAARPVRPAGKCYTNASYGRAVARGAKAAGARHWAPNQLRHAAGEDAREFRGLDAAQVILGHSTARMSEHYAKANLKAGAAVARAIG